jgi:hypothetical protein
MNFTSFKNRTINPNVKIKVYRNLHNGKMSVQQGGLVVGHCDEILLNRAEFVVNESGRQRVIKEKRKNVHAFVVGYLFGGCLGHEASGGVPVSYNPYKMGAFYVRETGEAVTKAAMAAVGVAKGIRIF